MALFSMDKKVLIPKVNKLLPENKNVNTTQISHIKINNTNWAYCNAEPKKYYHKYVINNQIKIKMSISTSDDINLLLLLSIRDALKRLSYYYNDEIIIYSKYTLNDILEYDKGSYFDNYKIAVKSILDLIKLFKSCKFEIECPYKEVINYESKEERQQA